MKFSISDIENLVTFKTSRSGGKGGQNVNKVSTKAELNLDLNAITIFSPEDRERLFEKLKNRINNEGILQVVSQEERSQLLNKERSLAKVVELINSALHKEKPRKKTRPGKTAVEKRLKSKLAQAKKKIERKRNFDF